MLDNPYLDFNPFYSEGNGPLTANPLGASVPAGMVIGSGDPASSAPGDSRSTDSPRELNLPSAGSPQAPQAETTRLKSPGYTSSDNGGGELKDQASPTRPRVPAPASAGQQLPVFAPMPPPSGVTSLLKSRAPGLYGAAGGLLEGGLGVQPDSSIGAADNPSSITALIRALLMNNG